MAMALSFAPSRVLVFGCLDGESAIYIVWSSLFFFFACKYIQYGVESATLNTDILMAAFFFSFFSRRKIIFEASFIIVIIIILILGKTKKMSS